MNSNHKLLFTFFLVATAFLLILGVGFSFAQDRSYTIPGANIDLTVGDDGTLHVKEVIHYHFSGTYNGVYRDIPLKSGELVENIQVNTSGAYSRYEVQDTNHGKRIKVFLYDDTAITLPFSDGETEIIYQYDFLQLVKFYNDVAELHYQPWGEEWEVPVGRVSTTIHLKSENGVRYWINPPYLLDNASWQGSVFTVISKEIPRNQCFEVRMAIPLEQFTSMNGGRQVNQNGTMAMEKIQADYTNWINFQTLLYQFLPVVMLLSVIYPFYVIYKSWGGKIIHKGSCDGNLPENNPPAVVNAICGLGISRNVGDPGVDGFLATMMDLIRRRYIVVYNSNENDGKGIKLKINEKKGSGHLKSFEKKVLNFVNEFGKKGTVYLDEMNESLEKTHFQKRYFDWRKAVIKELSHGKLESVFLETDNKGLYIYVFVALLGSLLLIALTFKSPIAGAKYSFYVSFPIIVVAGLSLLLTANVNGRWTDYGRDYRARWMMYKKYIKDTKHHFPDSEELFNEYLVYGTALGVGDDITKSSEKTAIHEEFSNSPLYTLHNSADYKYFKYTLVSFMAAYAAMQIYLTGGDGGEGSGGFGGGGVGGAGGGSGGGGGGAF
ncbi:MAG: DUF2207 domain-containing protein [Methanobacterium sp.]|nr:DUF2207 domain-containing protein [Methanobacterium sp.]